MKIIERLLTFIKYINVSNAEFERECGISNGYINKSKKGKGSITEKVSKKIFNRYPELNPDWLLNDNGEMIIDKKCDNTEYEKLKEENKILKEELIRYKKIVDKLTNN